MPLILHALLGGSSILCLVLYLSFTYSTFIYSNLPTYCVQMENISIILSAKCYCRNQCFSDCQFCEYSAGVKAGFEMCLCWTDQTTATRRSVQKTPSEDKVLLSFNSVLMKAARAGHHQHWTPSRRCFNVSTAVTCASLRRPCRTPAC